MTDEQFEQTVVELNDKRIPAITTQLSGGDLYLVNLSLPCGDYKDEPEYEPIPLNNLQILDHFIHVFPVEVILHTKIDDVMRAIVKCKHNNNNPFQFIPMVHNDKLTTLYDFIYDFLGEAIPTLGSSIHFNNKHMPRAIQNMLILEAAIRNKYCHSLDWPTTKAEALALVKRMKDMEND